MKFKFLIICLILLTACSGTNYDNEDVIAVLKGEEIKAKDILSQYSLEDKNIEIYIKEEIIILEAKSKGIAVSEQEIQENKKMLFPGADTGEILKIIPDKDKEFYEKQAAVLGISPEEYFDIWNDAYHSRDAYIQKYIVQKFGEPTSVEDGELLSEDIDDHINKLLSSYKENGELILN
ncbi:hypothetical protein [Halalkalibacter flavus]|uniref:hypothetical protein n=1 Tax=Halalkalibacter flavus TaxID=3090668 RepID=UPI002FCB228A